MNRRTLFLTLVVISMMTSSSAFAQPQTAAKIKTNVFTGQTDQFYEGNFLPGQASFKLKGKKISNFKIDWDVDCDTGYEFPADYFIWKSIKLKKAGKGPIKGHVNVTYQLADGNTAHVQTKLTGKLAKSNASGTLVTSVVVSNTAGTVANCSSNVNWQLRKRY